MMPFQQSPLESFMFTAFPIIFVVMFVFILGMFIVGAVKGIGEWKYNNAQPVLSVAASVVAKRADVRRRSSSNANGVGHRHSTYTRYFATFQVESGDRMELEVKDKEYGLLVEGDIGFLTFQGTRYHGFKRKMD